MNTATTPTEHVRDLLKDFSTAMLVTHERGTLRARPMTLAKIGDDLEIWFISAADSAKTRAIDFNPQAHVVCQKDHCAYLSIAGSAELVFDAARINEVWREPFRVWFPDGKDDPTLALIRFQPRRIEFWDSTGFKNLAYLWEAAVAYVIGDTPTIREGEQHGVVDLE